MHNNANDKRQRVDDGARDNAPEELR